MKQCRQAIADALDLETVDDEAYHDQAYLETVLAAGFDVSDLASAHDVAKKSIYRAINRQGIEYEQPPSNGPARALWNSQPATIGGDD
jgi:hypothetical protein